MRKLPQRQSRAARDDVKSRSSGFSLVEILFVIGLVSILTIAAFNSVTLLQRSSRRQALHTTAMELAQGKIEELLGTLYAPPLAPYYATNFSQSTNVTLSLDPTGTSNWLTGSMKTEIAPVAQGHLVTVTVATTNGSLPLNVRLQTIINGKSAGQP